MRVLNGTLVPLSPPLISGKLYQYPYAVNLWERSGVTGRGDFTYKTKGVIEPYDPFVVFEQTRLDSGTYLKVLTGSAEVGLVGYSASHLELAVDRKEMP